MKTARKFTYTDLECDITDEGDTTVNITSSYNPNESVLTRRTPVDKKHDSLKIVDKQPPLMKESSLEPCKSSKFKREYMSTTMRNKWSGATTDMVYLKVEPTPKRPQSVRRVSFNFKKSKRRVKKCTRTVKRVGHTRKVLNSTKIKASKLITKCKLT